MDFTDINFIKKEISFWTADAQIPICVQILELSESQLHQLFRYGFVNKYKLPALTAFLSWKNQDFETHLKKCADFVGSRQQFC